MFVSAFFVLFLTITWLIYNVVPKNWRKAVLLLFSYIFCGYISVFALLALAISTLITYVGARLVESRKSKSIAIIVGMLFALALVVIKNIPWVIGICDISFISPDHFLRKIVLPVGFSFYAFQSIGYIYDVFRKKESANKDFISFALYMGFWGKFVSGPIERHSKFCEQLQRLNNIVILESGRLSLAVTYIIWGYFLKLVVADRLAMIVDSIHMAPEVYDSVWLVGGAILYSFQIYTDFAGYTNIAVGCAMLFGIELTQNFSSPYCAKNITEFWRRWHISLSSWLRDYVYIPLGGNRKGKARKNINTLIVFILCGIWHGNGLSFLVWGLMHGMFSVIDGMIGKKESTSYNKKLVDDLTGLCSTIVTFIGVTFAWIFFRAESLTLACTYIKHMCTAGINMRDPMDFFVSTGGNMIQLFLSILLVMLVWIIDGACYKRAIGLPEFLQQNRIWKYIFFYIAIMSVFIFGIYGNGFNPENFIYMQF